MNEPIVKPKKHMRAFWPIVIIAVMAIVAGGLVVWTSFTGSLNDDVSSMVFQFHKKPTMKECSKETELSYDCAQLMQKSK